MAEKHYFRYAGENPQQHKVLTKEEQDRWKRSISFGKGYLTFLGSCHTSLNNPESLPDRVDAACFETTYTDVPDMYKQQSDKKYPEFEFYPQFKLNLPDGLWGFANGQYHLVLKKLIEKNTSSMFATDSPLGETSMELEQDSQRKALTLLATPAGAAIAFAAASKLQSNPLLSRRNFLVGAGAAALTAFLFADITTEPADPKNERFYKPFSNRLRELMMTLKLELVRDILEKRGVEKPEILFAVGFGHVESVANLMKIPREERVRFVKRMIVVLREDYGETGKLIAQELCSTANVPEMTEIKENQGDDQIMTTKLVLHNLSDFEGLGICS